MAVNTSILISATGFDTVAEHYCQDIGGLVRSLAFRAELLRPIVE